jgi:hypothetical protein
MRIPGSGAGQVPVRPHGSGSQAHETVDGRDATTELLRHAGGHPYGDRPGDIDKTPVFDRAGLAPAQCPLLGEKRKHVLALSFSGFDPKRTSYAGNPCSSIRHGPSFLT